MPAAGGGMPGHPAAKRPMPNNTMPPGVTISPIARAANLNTAVAISPNVSISRTSAPVTGGANVQRTTNIQLPKQPLPVSVAQQPPTAVAAPATAAAGSKQVIDVVDLSDEEDGGNAAASTTGQTVVQTVARPVTTVAYTYGPGQANTGQPARQILLTPAGGAGAPVRGVQQGGTNYLIPVAGGARQVIMPAASVASATTPNAQRFTLQRLTHPAPPPDPVAQSPFVNGKRPPAQPVLKINCTNGGIVLSWDIKSTSLDVAPTKCYQIYAYQENSNQQATSSLWKKVGDVKALPLPMACTLTQFSRGNRYHFAVRAEDHFKRVSQFSEPQSISLN